MKKLLILLFVFILSSTIYAQDFKIEGNGENSQNSIKINVQTTQSIQQENVTTINNTVDCSASTGNNQANGNNGNTTIITGDANCVTTIKNDTNTNTITPPVKSTITPSSKPESTITPTPYGNNPQPTATPGPGTSDNKSNNPDNGNTNGGNGSGSTNNGEVMGLAATSGESPLQTVWSVAGVICLALGSLLLKPQQN